ncbi:MAG TPA: DUF6345 domain-containing protein [Streptosporangiaceae bacterium]
MQLPVYRVAATTRLADQVEEFGQKLFGAGRGEVRERGLLAAWTGPGVAIDVDTARGGYFAADRTRLWRPDLATTRVRLPSEEEARGSGQRLLTETGALPVLRAPFRFTRPRIGGTVTAVQRRDQSRRELVRNDVRYGVDVELDLSAYGVGTVPLVGGGGRFSLTFGEAGRVIGSHGVWRSPTKEAVLMDVIPEEETDERFRALTSGIRVRDFRSRLAYYSAPSFVEQEFLAPVRVYFATIDVDGRAFPMRAVTLPACEVGPSLPRPVPQPPRGSPARPHVRPLPADLRLEPGGPVPLGVRMNTRALRDRGIDPATVLTADPGRRGRLIVHPEISPAVLRDLPGLLGTYSAGTSWIGELGGLAGSQDNAQGFVDGLADAAWSIRFNWGNANAWETDWRKNDDDWVDAVDFVFYTGHAGADGWMLVEPEDSSLVYAETAGAPDLWGEKNLDWLVIAACGPLQDDAVRAGGGNAVDRWKTAFDGLHLLMGYAEVTYDNTEEGRRLVQYARAGDTLMSAWFRTAQEIQPSKVYEPDGPIIYASTMWVGGTAGSTAGDHLWGYGDVGPDLPEPLYWACTWSGC